MPFLYRCENCCNEIESYDLFKLSAAEIVCKGPCGVIGCECCVTHRGQKCDACAKLEDESDD